MSDKEKEIRDKYKRLAAEYAKVSAHVEVLKRGVIDEQKCTTSLKSIVKGLEQQLRKSNQEIESLTFRNQQLVKRISCLQNDLQIPQAHSYYTNGANYCVDSLIDQKLIENAELSALLTKQKTEMAEYQKQINDLQENLDKERRSRSEFEKKLREELKYTLENSMKIKYQKKLESLQMDNQELNSKANSYWNEIIVLETRLKDILNITSSSSLES